MKKIILFSFLASMIIAAPAFARMKSGGMDGKNMSFEDMQKMRLEHIDKRMGFLQEYKTCVSAAKDKAELKKCKSAHESSMKSLKGDK